MEDIAAVCVLPSARLHSVAAKLILSQGAKEVLHIQRQMSLHLSYCAGFGLSKKDVEGQEEHQGD